MKYFESFYEYNHYADKKAKDDAKRRDVEVCCKKVDSTLRENYSYDSKFVL
jgi:hypothetical protein